MSHLREIRLTRLQLAALALISAIATASIVADALGRTAAKTAAVQALKHRPVIVETHPSQAASPAAATGASDPAEPSYASSVPSIGSDPTDASNSASSGSSADASSDASTSSGSGSSTTSTTSGSSGSSSTSSSTGSSTATTSQHKVKHVFVIALSAPSFDDAFGQGSVASYLNGTLRPKGTLLSGYETLGPSELPDYLAMVSGQAPNADTEGDCSTYSEFPAGAAPNASGVVTGAGCIYPNTVLTIGDQVTAAGHTWRGYIEDMSPETCVHPNSDAVDNAPLVGAGADYATRHNPFIYFHSLLDLGGCSEDDVSLTELPGDLGAASTAPTYAFIAPEACLDASASSCPDGGPAGLAGEDAFLKQWVPTILHSAAYKRDGVLIIAFAYSPASGTTAPQGNAPVRTGALVISRYAARGKTVSKTYDPYSLLRSVELLLGYTPLAGAKSASSFIAKALPRLG